MKTLFSLIASILSTTAFATQHIDCIPTSSDDTSHVIVSLEDHNKGTLLFSTGIADDGASENSGVLKLTRAPSIASLAGFTAENELNEFTFLMPSELVQRPFDGIFSAEIRIESKLNSSEFVQKLSCFTSIF